MTELAVLEPEIKEEIKKPVFKLIPLYEVPAVLKNWKYIREGMERVLHYALNDTSEAKIINEIMTGNLLLWLGFVDDVYCGFVTTQVEMIPPTMARFLNVKQLYIKPGIDKEIFFEGFETLKDFCDKNQCTKMRFWTIRDGWKKKLTKEGWKQGYVEYYKDLKGGGKQ